MGIGPQKRRCDACANLIINGGKLMRESRKERAKRIGAAAQEVAP
jgi:hypothetical protein